MDLKVLDLNALAQASLNVGLEFRTDQKTHKWYGRFVGDYRGNDAAARTRDPKTFGKCEHAIGVPNNTNAYEIGVVKATDGDGFALVYDNWHEGYGLEAVAGRSLERLRQEYAAETSARSLMAEGYDVTRHVDQSTGEVVVMGYQR